MIVPKKNLSNWQIPKDIEVVGVDTVSDALNYALGG